MAHIDKIHTIVIDAGGRYGLHPSWKPFNGALKYYLFEHSYRLLSFFNFKFMRRWNLSMIMKHLIETTLHPKLWRGFFPEGEKDERFVLYRLLPESFEWMKEWELKYRRVDLPS